MNMVLEGILAKLPIAEIKGTIHKHIKPLEMKLPDKRLDDLKMFAKVGQSQQEFVYHASHLERIVEVYNAQLAEKRKSYET